MLAVRRGWHSESSLRRQARSKTPPSEPDGTDAQQKPPRHCFKGTRPLQSHALRGTAASTSSPVQPPPSTATWARTQTPLPKSPQ